MSAAVLLDPYSSLEISAHADSRTMGSDVPLIRRNTPRLAAHDYRRTRYSPALSPSPGSDYRRVRRKPSIQNLTGRSALSAFSWTPSSIPPPSTHTLGLHDTHLQEPSTPRPRAYIASPSLSSTITTLQSTPTHTPILRAGSFDERRREFDPCALERPIGTKRKFSVRHARRFPRRQASGQGSEDSGIFKVYAAVFDLSSERGGLKEKGGNPDEQHHARSQAAPNSKRERAVRFIGVDTRLSNRTSSSPSSGNCLHGRQPTASSSYSLSKFEFPAPPNKDNWAGALDHLPRSPSASVLYRGASFDLLNPHASLLLGTHSIETPAEIDGLLDDYFENRDEFIVMASNPDTGGEATQQSVRSVSDTKQTNILYDDADTARRTILNLAHSPTKPSQAANAALRTAEVTPGFVQEALSNGRSLPLKRSTTRSKFAALGRSLGFGKGAGNQDLAEEGRSNHTEIHSLDAITGEDSAKNNEEFTVEDGGRGSNPFDLQLSQDSSNAELTGIDGVLQRERDAVLEPAADPNGQRTAMTVEDGPNTHAVSVSETEPDIGLFIDGYNYTREMPPAMEDPSLIAAIERGLNPGANFEEPGGGWYTPVPEGERFPSSDHGYDMLDDPEFMQPRPLDTRRNAFVSQDAGLASFHRNMRLSETSVSLTSEQTYGNTNQLLLLSDPTTVDRTRNVRVFEDEAMGDTSPLPPRAFHYNDQENFPPRLDEGRDDRSFEDDWVDPEWIEPADRLRTDNTLVPLRQWRDGSVVHSFEPYTRMRAGSMVANPSLVVVSRGSHPAGLRVSYNGSGWETERSESPSLSTSPGLTEEMDVDENGNRFTTPGASNEGSAESRTHPNPGVQSPFADLNVQGALATDGFPNLDDPQAEVSPQRDRSERKRPLITPNNYLGGEIDDGAQHSPRVPTRHYQQHKAPHSEYVPTQFDSGFVPPPIDFTSEPTGDAKRAFDIIIGKAQGDHVGFHRLCSPGDHSITRRQQTKDMEWIRTRNPNAMNEAIARFSYWQLQQKSETHAELSPVPSAFRASTPPRVQTSSLHPSKLQKSRKLNPFGPKGYLPSNSFQKAATLGRHDEVHGSFSSRRELLARQTPPGGGLAYSDSRGTFMTQRDSYSGQLKPPHGEWDPFQSSPTARILDPNRRHPAFSAGGTSRLPSNLRSISGTFGRHSRPAVKVQIEMRPLRMRTDSGTGRMTDEELNEREPGWKDDPASRGLPYTNAKLIPHTLFLEQKGISIKYLILARLIPFGPLVFGLGGLDRIIAKKTHGRITTMGRKQKKLALVLYLPLQLLLFAIIGIVVGILVHLQI